LDKRGKEDYGLPEAQELSKMEDRLKRLNKQEPQSL
jgi:hypothetical protein